MQGAKTLPRKILSFPTEDARILDGRANSAEASVKLDFLLRRRRSARDKREIEEITMSSQAEPILFYRTGDKFGEFSNFALFPIEVDGDHWPTTEHYFQAQKFAGSAHARKIQREPSPSRAASLGRDTRHPLRPDWEAIKCEVMLTAVRAKFRQHSSLRRLLLSTGNAELVEHTGRDSFWGDGGNGTGANRLGKILMQVRAELAAEPR